MQARKYLSHIEDVTSDLKIVSAGAVFDAETLPLLSNNAIYITSYSKRKLLLQRGISELLGYDQDEFSYNNFASLLHPEDRDWVFFYTKLAFDYARTYGISFNATLHTTFRIKHKSGRFVSVERISGLYESFPDGTFKSNYALLRECPFPNLNKSVQCIFKGIGAPKESFHTYAVRFQKSLFSEQELKVLNLLDKGFQNRHIAAELNISPETVRTHRKNMMEKAKCGSLYDLLIFYRGNRHLDPQLN